MANDDDDDMEKPVTKREMHEAFEIWGGALNSKLDATAARLDAKIDALAVRVDRLGHDLSAELAQHANRILDAVHEIAGAVDEEYNDLPARVTRLEAKVFPPKRQRQRRR